MSSVETLIDLLRKAYLKEGKTEQEVDRLILHYLAAVLDRMCRTDPSIDKQIQRRIETAKKVEGKMS